MPGCLRTTLVVLAVSGCGTRAPVAGQAPAQLPPGAHVIALRHGGLDRTYRVNIPTGTPIGARHAVVLAFHGGGGNAGQFQRTSGLPELGEREVFIAVFPDGIGRLGLHTWNAGGCCGGAMDRDIDDVGFVRTLLDDLARRAAVDPRRVYATGHSNGGMMTYRVAAELGDRIAAAIPVGGAMHLESFRPVRPVPLLHIHSVDDPRALYRGGEGPPFPGTNRTVVHRPVEEGLAAWRRINGCTGNPSHAQALAGGQDGPNAGQTATLLRWEPCASGAPVEHWRLTGSGHGWPGQTRSVLRTSIIGPSTTLIDAAEEVWKFARRHSLP